jgi:amidase
MAEREAFDVNTATTTATARAVRDGTISAREACDAAIARIERADGPINAVVVRDFDRARAAAKYIDTTRTKDDRRPLLGVPMTVKESNDVAGLPSTWGMAVFKDLPVHEDSVAVARLKAAGAVILGKTNAPVALADWQAVNPIYGRTVNPHDHTRTPGGSSGGAAAALAAGMVPLELGSDIGGSIRVPAHMCGVFGHKPTYGLIPLNGHGFPGTDTIDVPLAVVGPMARSVEDLRVALGVLAGPLPGIAYKLDLPPARHTSLSAYRVLVLDHHPSAATDTTIRNALHTLAGKLERSGARIDDHTTAAPDLAAAHLSYTKMLTAVTTRGTPGITPIDAHAWMELEDEQMRLARHWQTVFSDFDIVLAPTFGTPAFPHEDEPNWNARKLKIDGQETPYGAQVAWPGVATFPGLPATAVPIAKNADGLPIGLQIIGAKFDDRTTLSFASLLEQDGLTV